MNRTEAESFDLKLTPMERRDLETLMAWYNHDHRVSATREQVLHYLLEEALARRVEAIRDRRTVQDFGEKKNRGEFDWGTWLQHG